MTPSSTEGTKQPRSGMPCLLLIDKSLENVALKRLLTSNLEGFLLHLFLEFGRNTKSSLNAVTCNVCTLLADPSSSLTRYAALLLLQLNSNLSLTLLRQAKLTSSKRARWPKQAKNVLFSEKVTLLVLPACMGLVLPLDQRWLLANSIFSWYQQTGHDDVHPTNPKLFNLS